MHTGEYSPRRNYELQARNVFSVLSSIHGSLHTQSWHCSPYAFVINGQWADSKEGGGERKGATALLLWYYLSAGWLVIIIGKIYFLGPDWTSKMSYFNPISPKFIVISASFLTHLTLIAPFKFIIVFLTEIVSERLFCFHLSPSQNRLFLEYLFLFILLPKTE